MKTKSCVVCGMRVEDHRTHANTCDPLCTRAKHAGRSRAEQQEAEMQEDAQHDYRQMRQNDPSYRGFSTYFRTSPYEKDTYQG